MYMYLLASLPFMLCFLYIMYLLHGSPAWISNGSEDPQIPGHLEGHEVHVSVSGS